MNQLSTFSILGNFKNFAFEMNTLQRLITWVHDEHIFLAILVESIKEGLHLVNGKIFGVQCEISKLVHVVNVRPHHFQWNASLGITIDHTLHILHVLVTIPALVEA